MSYTPQMQTAMQAVANTISAKLSGEMSVYPYPDRERTPPTIEVAPAGGDFVQYWLSMGSAGIAQVNLVVRVRLNVQDAETAANQMTRLLSPGGDGESLSIIDALLADNTLGGAVENIHVSSCSWDPDAAPGPYTPEANIECRVVLRKQGANA